MYAHKLVVIPKHVLKGLQLFRFSTTTISAAAATETTPKRLPKGYNGPNAYALFTKQQHNAGLSITEQAKQIAEKWNALSPEEKQKYKEESEQITKARATEFAKLGKGAQSSLIVEDAAKKEKLVKHRIRVASKKFRLDTNHPNRPLTPYLRYYKQEISKVGNLKKDNIAQHAASIGNAWKQLSDAEKKPLQDAYDAELKKYNEVLAKWTKDYGAEYKKLRAQFRPKPKKVVKAKKASATPAKRGRKGGLYKRLTTRKTASASKKTAAKK